MTREEKNQQIDILAEQIKENPNFYIADISGLNADDTSKLRRLAFKKEIGISVIKNTLLRKAMDRIEEVDYSELYDVLKGNSSLFFSPVGNAPAKLIKEFRKKSERPVLKAAFVEETAYVGDDQLDALSNIKSKDELLADVIALLQSPAKNVVSALNSGGNNLTGILKALEERG